MSRSGSSSSSSSVRMDKKDSNITTTTATAAGATAGGNTNPNASPISTPPTLSSSDNSSNSTGATGVGIGAVSSPAATSTKTNDIISNDTTNINSGTGTGTGGGINLASLPSLSSSNLGFTMAAAPSLIRKGNQPRAPLTSLSSSGGGAIGSGSGLSLPHNQNMVNIAATNVPSLPSFSLGKGSSKPSSTTQSSCNQQVSSPAPPSGFMGLPVPPSLQDEKPHSTAAPTGGSSMGMGMEVKVGATNDASQQPKASSGSGSGGGVAGVPISSPPSNIAGRVPLRPSATSSMGNQQQLPPSALSYSANMAPNMRHPPPVSSSSSSLLKRKAENDMNINDSPRSRQRPAPPGAQTSSSGSGGRGSGGIPGTSGGIPGVKRGPTSRASGGIPGLGARHTRTSGSQQQQQGRGIPGLPTAAAATITPPHVGNDPATQYRHELDVIERVAARIFDEYKEAFHQCLRDLEAGVIQVIRNNLKVDERLAAMSSKVVELQSLYEQGQIYQTAFSTQFAMITALGNAATIPTTMPMNVPVT